MTSAHRTGQTEAHPKSSEATYERLSAYTFARRYVGGKTVAEIVIGRPGEAGYGTYGSLLLAGGAESVEVVLLSGSPKAGGSAQVPHRAPNISYRKADLPKLPYAEGYFDVVVAFGVLEELERPEELLGEAKRVLKENGVLLLSSPDKRADTREHQGPRGDRRGGMYVGELRELVGRYFEGVHIYRQGAVAGGFVFPEPDGTADGEATSAAVTVEVGRFSVAEPGLARLDAQPPTTHSVVAVCYDRALGREEGQEQPYLILDRDRRVFEESEDLAEDVGLMLGEIEQMQRSEVQAFVEAIRAQRQQNLAQLQMRYLLYIRSFLGHRRNAAREDILHLRNVIREDILHRRNIIYGNIYALRKKGLKGSVRGALRRSVSLYRRLATRDGSPD